MTASPGLRTSGNVRACCTMVVMADMVPAVTDLADMVLRIAGQAWPATEIERVAMFDRLGLRLVDEPPTPSADPRLTFQPVQTPLPAVTGSLSEVDGKFLGLDFFAYAQHQDDGPWARQASPELKRLVSAGLGDPAEEWGSAREPACSWLTGALRVEMYCFQRLTSVVMLGIDHVARSEAYEESRNG